MQYGSIYTTGADWSYGHLRKARWAGRLGKIKYGLKPLNNLKSTQLTTGRSSLGEGFPGRFEPTFTLKYIVRSSLGDTLQDSYRLIVR